MDLESRSVLISRNVIFHETIFPFKISDLLGDIVDMFPNTILPMPAPLHFVENMPSDLPSNDGNDDIVPDMHIPSPSDHSSNSSATSVPHGHIV